MFHPFADSWSSPPSLAALSCSVLPMAQERVLGINTKLHLASDGEHWIFSSKSTFLSNANSPGSEGPAPVRSLLPPNFLLFLHFSFLPCLASFLSQLISFLWLLLSPPNTHQHILTQIRTLEGPGLYPWGKVALEEFRESTLKPCAEWPLPIGRVGIRPLNIELKDEASLPTIHSTISLHLTPKTPM